MDSAPHTDRAKAGEIILKVLAEGGSLTLARIKAANGWRFRVDKDEPTLIKVGRGSPDKYSRHRLHAMRVHPRFKRQIWAAVQRKAREDDSKWARCSLDRWQHLCETDPMAKRRVIDVIVSALMTACAACIGAYTAPLWIDRRVPSTNLAKRNAALSKRRRSVAKRGNR
jgi:hypothetical protein